MAEVSRTKHCAGLRAAGAASVSEDARLNEIVRRLAGLNHLVLAYEAAGNLSFGKGSG